MGKSKQRGMSFIMLLLTIGVIGSLILVGLKLIPVYMNAWKVEKALESVKEAGLNRSRNDLKQALYRQLDIDQVDVITWKDFDQYVSIQKAQGKTSIDVVYDHEVELIGNLSLVAYFEMFVEE